MKVERRGDIRRDLGKSTGEPGPLELGHAGSHPCAFGVPLALEMLNASLSF